LHGMDPGREEGRRGQDLRVPRWALEEVLAHARAEAPIEACGLLAGRGGRVERVYRLTNSDRSPYTYNADPKELLAAFNEMEEEGLELVAIYHSHPATRAYPSATDVERAFYPEAFYVIVSLSGQARGEPPEVRAFRIAEGRVEEQTLSVE
jgi:proteasome lid subunit RPN8/RPN11